MIKKTELDFYEFYKSYKNIFRNGTIDLSEYYFIHPWPVIWILIKLIDKPGLKIIFPENNDTLSYLKRIRFDAILKDINYQSDLDIFNKITISSKENLNIQELIHCHMVDEFNARLFHFIKMFRNFGLSETDSYKATNIVAELGNNVFDHNLGSWPHLISGSFIVGKNYPNYKKMEITIGDPGIGYYGSLRARFPNMKEDIEAIELGLKGNTGWIDVKRGNGLKYVQKWTIQDFDGQIMIHSGSGLAIIKSDGINYHKVDKIQGTIAQFVIKYK